MRTRRPRQGLQWLARRLPTQRMSSATVQTTTPVPRSAPLRVALISEHASPLATAGGVDAGGQNIYVASVARSLAAQGHRVDVLTRRDDPTLPPVVNMGPGVRVLHVDAGPAEFVRKEALMRWMPDFAQQARRLLQRWGRHDVIHANFFMSGWVGLLLARRFELPLVTTFHALGLVRREHQQGDDEFPPERIAIELSLVRWSDRVVAECPQDSSDLMRLYGASSRRLVTIPCGVDTQMFRPGDRVAARARLGLPQDEFIVLQLGRLVPRKGIDNVIRAVACLPSQLRPRLYVVGGGSERPDERVTPEIGRLRAVAQQCGADARVSFVGRRDRQRLRDWYVAANAFVTTPWYEPFGITPLEAMACATPVVGSAVGGIAHTVREGITGWLVPPRDPAALAERLVRLAQDPAQAEAFGRAGLARVRAEFTWDQVARQLAALYAQLAADNAAAAVSEPELALSAPREVREARTGLGSASVAGR
jgi:D-inositol-3-phosphate glycosyltransferase